MNKEFPMHDVCFCIFTATKNKLDGQKKRGSFEDDKFSRFLGLTHSFVSFWLADRICTKVDFFKQGDNELSRRRDKT